jgi:carbonic anhydrase
MTHYNFFRYMAITLAIPFLTGCAQKTKESTDPLQKVDSTSVQTSPSSARPVHWGYGGDIGPTAWATLSPAYALCAEGKGQSPINLTKTDASGELKWNVDYKQTSMKIAHTEHMEDIIDNGHTIQVSVDEGSTLTLGDKKFMLKQFHFHTPSEHTIDGKNMPMEMHMVHQSDDGNLAVLGILFKEGKTANPNLAKIIANLPAAKGQTNHVKDQQLDLNVQIPADNYAYHYIGSLTTPPCSENVQWLVLREMVTVTADQINALSSRISPNNRPTQPLNERKVDGVDISGQTN